jgi:outer membrane protein OmpA-like peptidoglycan-associated protein
MKTLIVAFVICFAGTAYAQLDMGAIKDKAAKTVVDKGGAAAEKKANEQVVNKVNKKLLAEGQKNQCSFKSGTDVLEPGCDGKMKKLATQLIDAHNALEKAKVPNFKFVVYGHTDTVGKPEDNKELSNKRAAVIVKELIAKGVNKEEIESVGMGAEKPLVKPDDTPAKKAKNRRYEIQVKI